MMAIRRCMHTNHEQSRCEVYGVSVALCFVWWGERRGLGLSAFSFQDKGKDLFLKIIFLKRTVQAIFEMDRADNILERMKTD